MGYGLRLDAAKVTSVRTAIYSRVGVQGFHVKARLRQADAVATPQNGGGVEDHDDKVFWSLAVPGEGKDAVVGVIGIDPFEAWPVEVHLVERGFLRIQLVQVTDEALKPAMGFPLKQMPVETPSFAEFLTLAEFLAHEQEFLTRVRILIGVEEAQVSELLPHVAGHFVEQGIFAVNDFIVGERQHEVFGEGIYQREG